VGDRHSNSTKTGTTSPFCLERLLSRHVTTKCVVVNVHLLRIILCYRLIDFSKVDRWPNNAGRITRRRTRMTRRSSPPSRGQADRVGPAVHRRNGVPHPSKLELINTGHAAGYTAVHWSPKRSCDARKPRSTTNSGSKGPRIVTAMTEGFVVDSPTGRTGHRRRFPRVGRCHRSPVIQHHSWHRARCR
jgi:hypothetical protein